MPFTLVDYRAKLRTDLKDSGSLWSDAELDRAVKRSYDDFSRHLPLERVVDHYIDMDVTAESFTTGEDTDADQVVDGVDISATVSGGTLTITAQPDKPRVLTLTITDANSSITDFILTVLGSDENDVACEEVFLSGRGLVQTGKQIFKRVTSVTMTAITGNGASDVLDLGVGAITNVWHFLANSPIEPGSVSITNAAATVTYTENTDYVVDYSRGAIKLISGGSMAAATSYLATYEKHNVGFDLSVVIPTYEDVLRVTRVEYPTDQMPQKFVSYNIWNDFLHVTSKGTGQSQEALSDNKHIAFYYEQRHLPPTTKLPGSIPNIFDEIVVIGAQAYALFIKAYQQEHQSITDLASARTALSSLAAIHVLIDTAFDAVPTNVTLAVAALGAGDTIIASISTPLTAASNALTAADTAYDLVATTLGGMAAKQTLAGNALTAAGGALTSGAAIIASIVTPLTNQGTALTNEGTALAAIATQLGNLTAEMTSNGTALTAAGTALAAGVTAITALTTSLTNIVKYLNNNSNEDAAGWLTKITTDIASLRTAVVTAADAANAALDLVTTDFTNADGVWTSEAGEITAATGYIDTTKVDKVNVGDNVPSALANYTNVRLESARIWAQKRENLLTQANNRTQQAIGYLQEVEQRLANLQTYINQSAGWSVVADGFYKETQGRIAHIQARQTEAAQYISQANGYIQRIDQFIASATAYYNQSVGYNNQASGYRQQVEAYIAQVSAYRDQAAAYIQQADGYFREVEAIIGAARAYAESGNGFVTLAQGYISECGAYVNQVSAYQNEANQYLLAADARVKEGNGRIAEMQVYIAEAGQYQQSAQLCINLAARFNAEATDKRNEFWKLIADRSEYRKRVSSVAGLQNP